MRYTYWNAETIKFYILVSLNGKANINNQVSKYTVSRADNSGGKIKEYIKDVPKNGERLLAQWRRNPAELHQKRGDSLPFIPTIHFPDVVQKGKKECAVDDPRIHCSTFSKKNLLMMVQYISWCIWLLDCLPITDLHYVSQPSKLLKPSIDSELISFSYEKFLYF